MTKQATPSIRFIGFDDDWENKKLGNEVSFFSGLTYSPDDVKDSGILVLRSSNVKDGEIIDADNVYVEPAVVNSELVQENDIIVVVRNGSRSLIGKHAQIKKRVSDTVIGAFMTGIRADNPSFVNALLDTTQFKREISRNLGATINQITVGDFKQMQFWFPAIPEQSAIGSLFQKLDRLIGLHQDRLALMKAQKQTYLKKMFPQKGQKVPDLRFAGFTDEWEEKKLGDITKILKGTQRGKQEISAIQDNKNIYPVYNGGQNVSGYTNEYNRENKIIISEGGASAGFVNYVNDKFWSGGHNYSIDTLNNDLNFIRANLDGNQTKLYDLKVGSGLPNIQLSSVKMFDVFTTHLEEQQLIGNFFQSLDKAIVLQEKKIEELKEQKRTLLSKMFI